MVGLREDELLRFEILGTVRALKGDRELEVGPVKQRAVLAVLLLNANAPVRTTQIVDAVWEDSPPENGPNVVQKYVAGLRRVLEPGRSPRTSGRLLLRDAAGYQLHVASGCLDSDDFSERVRRARTARTEGRPADAAEGLRDALTLWRAEPLAGLTGAYFDAERARLSEARAAVLETCMEIELELGRHGQLLPELVGLVGEYPLREGLRYVQMLALYRCGRQAEALTAYRDARRFLVEEYGVEPGERLKDLHQRILRSDPALAPVSPETAKVATGSRPSARTGVAGPVRDGREAGTARDGSGAGRPGPPTSDAEAETGLENNREDDPLTGRSSTGRPLTDPETGAGPGREPGREPGWEEPSGAGGVPAGHGPAPPGYLPAWGPMPVSWTYYQPAPAGYSHWTTWVGRTVAVVLPLMSFGMLSWTVMAYLAVVRRSRAVAAAAVGYLLTAAVFWGAIGPDGDPTGLRDGVAILAVMLTWWGGTLHVIVLISTGRRGGGRPHRRADALLERRVRREQARALVLHHPDVARRLHVGRPDLPRVYDDGGLVDVNGAPEHVLAAVPEVGPWRARSIVAERELNGGYASVDDLVARRVLPAPLHPALRETLVAVGEE